MLAIITGTIRPSPEMRQLVLKDENERLRQYEEGIRFLLDAGAFSNMIFCENSNFGVEKLSYLRGVAEERKTNLELLSFQGNMEKACIQGKGYGEGEIMDYIFSHSRLIHLESYFIKITGRLKVEQIKKIVSHIHEEKTYFNIPNRTRRDIYDTRIYGMPILQFKNLFLKSYEQVMDEQGIFLEAVYTRVLQDNHIKVTNFPRYPRIIGVSGSGGVIYGYTEWKCKVKDVLSRFNFYTVKEPCERN